MAASSLLGNILGLSVFGGENTSGTLSYVHPTYANRWWWWEFYRISYVGGREYYSPTRLSIEFRFPIAEERTSDGKLSPTAAPDTGRLWYQSMLFRNAREDAVEFENRQKRASYYNFVNPIVNSLVSHAVCRPPTREITGQVEEPEEVEPAEPVEPGEVPEPTKPAAPKKPKPEKPKEGIEELWDQVDEHRSRNMDTFMRDGLRWANVYGIYWCCMDVDPEGDGKPYAYWVSPIDILDWHTDDDGNIEWLKQFVYTEAARPTFRDKRADAYLFRVWYKDHVETWQRDDRGGETLLGNRQYTIGRVPWEPLFSRRCEEYLFPDGVPLVGDLAKVANNVYNLTSQLMDIFEQQTFSQLVFPDPSGALDKVQIGTKRFLGLNTMGGGGEVKYISPDADQPRVLMEGIGMAISLARQMAGVGRGRAEGSMQQASADALELESDDKRSILSDLASEAEDFERRFADLEAAWRGEEKAENVYIQYTRDFNVRGYQAEVEEVLTLKSLSLPPAIESRLVEDLLRRRFAAMSPEQLEALLEPLSPEHIEAERVKKAEQMAAQFDKGADVGTLEPDDQKRKPKRFG